MYLWSHEGDAIAQHPDNPKKHILRDRVLYIRNSNAECAPLATVAELRELINLATAKRRDELFAMFDTILKGRPLLGLTSDTDRFNEELQRIEDGLAADTTYSDQLKAGAWRLVFRPSKYESSRWSSIDALESIIRRREVRLYETFPPSQEGTHAREWGIANDMYGEIWTLARSGQFVYVEEYRENTYDYEGKWMPAPPVIPKGNWLELSGSLRDIFNMTAFSARLCEEFVPGTQVEILMQATNLHGKKLASRTLQDHWGQSDQCRASLFEYSRTLPIEELRAEWRAIAADAMVKFVEYFPHPWGRKLTQQDALGQVAQYESRNI